MSTKNVMPVEQEVQGNESQNVNVVETNNVSYQNVIKKLIAAGCKKISQVKIKNVNFTEKDNYTMVSFTLGSAIRGFISEDNGVTYVEGMTKVMFTSLYAITGAFKEDENQNFVAAVDLAKVIFNYELKSVIGKVKAFKKVKEKLSKVENGILVLDCYLPYEEVILNSCQGMER